MNERYNFDEIEEKWQNIGKTISYLRLRKKRI